MHIQTHTYLRQLVAGIKAPALLELRIGAQVCGVMYILVRVRHVIGRSIHCSAWGGDSVWSKSPVCDRVVQVEAVVCDS